MLTRVTLRWDRTLLACALALLSACTVDGVDLAGKECPCADGWVCDEAANRCVTGGATGGSGGDAASGGSAGTPSGGNGGTATGGSGGNVTGGTGGSAGAATGGSGGTATGGSGGTATGGSGGTTTGGSGGTTTGGSGGTTTGGSGGTSSGGAGGTSTNAVHCGTTTCDLATDVCCHAQMGTSDQGSCVAKNGTCTNIRMFCDDAGDCGGGTNVCCAQLDPGGQLKTNVQCVSSPSNCTTSGNGSAVLLCDPAAVAPCPNGTSCKASSKMAGYSSCQP
jgi:hypothetical protein